MGNNMVAGSSKAAKIMKINGEFFKLKIPIKVFDVIKDYPDHVLLDSEDFLRFNLRAKPLNLEDELKPRKIYLLVDLPKFPLPNQSPLRRVQSGVLASTASSRDVRMKRSVSDDLTMLTRSTAAAGLDQGERGSLSVGGGSSPAAGVGPTRVKMRLPKAQMQRIVEESGDDLEAAKKIVRLCLNDNAAISGGEAVVERREIEGVGRKEGHCCLSIYGKCSHSSSYRRKYKKLTS